MAEEKPIPEDTIEVEKKVLRKGKLGFHPRYPTSTRLRLICETVVYTNAGVSALVGGSDIFTGYQSKVIGFLLGVSALIAGGLIKATGVKPNEETKD